jgi:hypothetical protein
MQGASAPFVENFRNAEAYFASHLFLQFASERDCSVQVFRFEGLRPNAQANDLLGGGWNKKQWQVSVDRGHFYVWANKKGTVQDEMGVLCVAGNYTPAWTEGVCTYAVGGTWPQKLWAAYKLTEEVYEEYLHLCKDGIPGRKRNFEAFCEWQTEREIEKDIAARTTRIRNNPDLYETFARVPQADPWRESVSADALRYPVLLVHGPSRCGKTEWAKSLFAKPLVLQIGWLTQFPDTMRKLNRKIHDSLILDDLRDLAFLSDHQEKLQGKYDAVVEFGTTPGGQCAFKRDLFRLPIIATINNSTRNLDFLRTNDFLNKPENVQLLSFRGRPGEEPPSDTLVF